MTVYRNLQDCQRPFTRPVITIGNFDGVHLGHQTLFAKVRERARAIAGESVVITFDPHPIKLMRPDRNLPLLTTTRQKLKLLQAVGVDHLIVHPFTREFAALSAEDFVEDYLLRRLGVHEVVVGHDYNFGRNRGGNIDLLRALGAAKGFPVHVVDAIEVNGIIVSSTLIRNLIAAGRVSEARTFLGRPYEVTGEVIYGNQRGGPLLGIPTANLRPDNDLLPLSGIYACRAAIESHSHPAVANIGTCPTFADQELSLEVHLLDFHGNLYGQSLAVEFIRRLRDEQRFPDLPSLIQQIQADIDQARQVLAQTAD